MERNVENWDVDRLTAAVCSKPHEKVHKTTENSREASVTLVSVAREQSQDQLSDPRIDFPSTVLFPRNQSEITPKPNKCTER